MTDETHTNETAGNGGLSASNIPREELARLTDDIIAAIKTVYDPEIPADIYELGLIYRIDIEDDRSVKIDMTLTAPGCPVAGENARLGAKCGQHRGRRLGCWRQHDFRSAMDAGPHVGRGPNCCRLVLIDDLPFGAIL